MGKLLTAYNTFKSGMLWSSTGRCKGFAPSNPGEAAKIDTYIAGVDAGTFPTAPTLSTPTGVGLVGMIAALAPAAPPPPPPPPPPTGKVRFGITNNLSGGGSLQQVKDIGATLIREDNVVPQVAKQNGLDCIQIVYPGDTPDPAAFAHEVVADAKNEPYWDGVDPKAWAVKCLAEVQRVAALKLGKPIIIPIVSYGARAGNNGMDGIDYPGQYAYPNGDPNVYMKGAASWIKTVNAAAPGLFALVQGFSAHSYFNDPPFHVLDTVRAEIEAIPSAKGKPFWITECGMYDTGTSASEQAAAATIQKEVTAVKARTDVAVYVPYRLGEALEGSAHWGCLRADGSQKPAWAIYKAAMAS